MDLLNLFGEHVPWSWIVGGFVLLAIELFAPGGVFVWLGGAAVVTGLITILVPLGLPVQFAVFGVLSVLGIASWIAMRRRTPPETDAPFLNKRVERVVGKEGFLSEPIRGEKGRMEIGESVWRVTGPELPAGHRVRIVGYKGTLLTVESAEEERTATV